MTNRDPQTKNLNVEIPADLHRRFKALVAIKGTTMQAMLVRLLEDAVAEQ